MLFFGVCFDPLMRCSLLILDIGDVDTHMPGLLKVKT